MVKSVRQAVNARRKRRAVRHRDASRHRHAEVLGREVGLHLAPFRVGEHARERDELRHRAAALPHQRSAVRRLEVAVVEERGGDGGSARRAVRPVLRKELEGVAVVRDIARVDARPVEPCLAEVHRAVGLSSRRDVPAGLSPQPLVKVHHARCAGRERRDVAEDVTARAVETDHREERADGHAQAVGAARRGEVKPASAAVRTEVHHLRAGARKLVRRHQHGQLGAELVSGLAFLGKIREGGLVEARLGVRRLAHVAPFGHAAVLVGNHVRVGGEPERGLGRQRARQRGVEAVREHGRVRVNGQRAVRSVEARHRHVRRPRRACRDHHHAPGGNHYHLFHYSLFLSRFSVPYRANHTEAWGR